MKSVANAVALTAFVIVEALQLLIIVALVYSFIPVPMPDFFKNLPLRLQKGLQPKREMSFYHWFLAAAFIGQIACVYFFKWRKMEIPRRELIQIAAVDAVLIFIELFAVFKIWQYEDPWWARALLYGGIVVWALVRIFWYECKRAVKLISEVVMEKSKYLKLGLNVLVPVLLVLCLWVPDISKVLGRVFVWSQFRHWNTNIMLPGWGFLHGQGLNTDAFSSWGIGVVMFISQCAQLLGGFDYAHVLTVMMGMVIVYYVALYFFLKAWLRSVLLAAAVVALAVKLQMFHTGISPLVWIFPQDTPLRHWLDLGVLWCLWQHARSFDKKYLLWAASGTGLAMAWAFSTGVCLLIAFWAYGALLLIVPEYRAGIYKNVKDIRWIFFSGIAMPVVVMMAALFLGGGSAVFNASFWKSLIEPMRLMAQGVGLIPFSASLYDRHFFAYIAGFIIPLIYVWTLIVNVGFIGIKKAMREDLFIIPLSIYGLALYTHYLEHSSISRYYAVGIPLVMVIGFWMNKGMAYVVASKKRKVLVAIVLLSWGALLTNIFFVYYPNVFNMARLDWRPEVLVYQSQFKFEQDASLVARLVPESKGAPIISSWEAEILRESKRRQFFYYAPLLSSERVEINGYQGTPLITQERAVRTINQIVQLSPEYIFVDRNFFGQWAKDYAQYYPGLFMVLRYIAEHYEAKEQGMILIGMRRK